jgi:hypothetical protein
MLTNNEGVHMTNGTTPEAGDNKSGGAKQATAPKVKWDDANMKTAYANVVNAASTREEVTLFFGTNQTWNVADAKELVIQLSDRIVLSPFAAKRLWILLGGVLNEYEKRHGKLEIETRPNVPGASA